MADEKKISEFQDITSIQFQSEDFWVYIQSLDGCEDYRILKSTMAAIMCCTPTSEKGITAFAGGGQVNARILTERMNRIDTCAVANASVVPSVTATKGFQQTIQNKGAEDMDYFPFSGNNFLGQAANAPVTIAPGNQLSVFCYETGVLTQI